ncbi:MAG: hypothetical protein ACK5LL_16050 [Suipraeoptans sp.]
MKEKLLFLRKKALVNDQKSETYKQRTIELYNKAKDYKLNLIKQVYYTMAFFVYLSFTEIIIDIEKDQRKSAMAKILNCSKSEVAGDINDFLKARGKVKYYAGDFTYNAVFHKKDMRKLEIILGDLDVMALDDLNILKNIRFVGGKLIASE